MELFIVSGYQYNVYRSRGVPDILTFGVCTSRELAMERIKMLMPDMQLNPTGTSQSYMGKFGVLWIHNVLQNGECEMNLNQPLPL